MAPAGLCQPPSCTEQGEYPRTIHEMTTPYVITVLLTPMYTSSTIILSCPSWT